MEKLEENLEQPRHTLTIWKHTANIPVIQWWMGVGISMAELAGAVAYEWWIGTLSAAALTMTPKYHEYRLHEIREAKKAAGGKLSKEETKLLFKKANIHCITQEIKTAKEIAQWNWVVFMNLMVASKDYNEYVKAACEAGIDGIVSWAGLPSNLHKLTAEYPDVSIIPILSREKWVKTIYKQWNRPYEVKSEIQDNEIITINGQKIENRGGELYQKNWTHIFPTTDKIPNTVSVGEREYTYTKDTTTNTIILTKQYDWKKPDAIILESAEKWWGHLWAIKGQLNEVNNPETSLEVAVPAVIQFLKQERKEQEDKDTSIRATGGIVTKENIEIPVIAAGGIITKEDVDKRLALWAKWVQMWTLFATTKESNAHEDFKNAIINAKQEDVGVYNSSALYPARYIKKSLEGEDVEGIKAKQQECLRECLEHCALRDWIPWYAQICIEKKLVHSTRWSDGKWLRFIGWPFGPDGENKIRSKLKISSSVTVKEIFKLLSKGTD